MFVNKLHFLMEHQYYFCFIQPALNAFNFETNQIKVVFEGLRNKPKI